LRQQVPLQIRNKDVDFVVSLASDPFEVSDLNPKIRIMRTTLVEWRRDRIADL